MNKLTFTAILWVVYLICASTIVVNAVLWMPAAMLSSIVFLGIGAGILVTGILCLIVTVGIDIDKK